MSLRPPAPEDKDDPHVLLGRIVDAATDLAHLVTRKAPVSEIEREMPLCARCGQAVEDQRAAAATFDYISAAGIKSGISQQTPAHPTQEE